MTRKKIEKLMDLPGEVRGIVFKTDAEFVLREKGKRALAKVEKQLKEWGVDLKYQEIEPMDFYLIGLRALSLLAIKNSLNLSNDDIRRMGAEAPRISLVIKLFAGFFFSLNETVAQAPKMWTKHFTVGRLVAKANEEKRKAVIKLKELNLDPIFCIYLEGYFATIIKMIVKSKVESREIKCWFKNRKNKDHQYLLTW
jgi:hypothetical protein